MKVKELFDSFDQLDGEFTVIFSQVLWQVFNPGISIKSEVIVFDHSFPCTAFLFSDEFSI